VKSQALKLGEFFLNYLLANRSVTRNPEEFCRRTYVPAVPYRDWLEARHRNGRALFDSNNLASEFLEWLLDKHLSTPDDLGRPVRSPEHWNPVTRLSRKAQSIQTHREAIPTRYINEMIRILAERDFAWPKSIASEWFSWFDPDAGRWQKIWSPVRVSAMLLKLYLPLRTFQIRMLDSGEADSERCVDGQWIANVGVLAPGLRVVVRKGFLRKFTDRLTGRVHTGFFVNTNKTQDRGKDEDDKGYEIPWQHSDAIRVVTDLLRWQERYNPIKAPTRWADLHDAVIVRSGRSGEFAKRGAACFLFRDPCGTYRNEPLTDSRLRTFWIALLNELERRVAARGEALADGSPIVFIDKRHPKSGEPLRPVYDLHTLRVTLITALATEGGVPIPILSKCVAGHASILMTLYYVKLGVPQITEQLAEAQKKIHVEEQRNFLRFLQSAQHKKLISLVASNDASGVTALHQNSPGSWVVSDKGICPVGGSLCNKGGPKLTSNIQLADYAPTPGGPRNCVRCRFFITGPAFLGGLVAHFNAIGVQLLAASERFRAKEAAIRKLEDELTAMEAQGISPPRLAELHAAYDHHERDMLEVDELSHNLHAVYRLTERCRAIIAKTKESPANGQVNLVLAGDQADLEAAIEMTTDFELMNSVCQVAKVYPGNDSTLANLRRARILDAMLARNGRRPVFSALSEDEALAVGNEFVNLLIRRLGHADTIALVEGKRMLDSTGITREVETFLEHQTGEPFELASPIVTGRARRLIPAPSSMMRNE
jgi:hypothetical protein